MVRTAAILVASLGWALATECESDSCPALQKDNVMLQTMAGTKSQVAKHGEHATHGTSNVGMACECNTGWNAQPCEQCGLHDGEPMYCCDNSPSNWLARWFYRNGHPCEKADYPAGATGGKCTPRGPVFPTTTTTTTTTTTLPPVEQFPCGTNIARGKAARCYGRYQAVSHHCGRHGDGPAKITDGDRTSADAPRFEIQDFNRDDSVIIDLGGMTAINQVTLFGKEGRRYHGRKVDIGREYVSGTHYQTAFQQGGPSPRETAAGTVMNFDRVHVGWYVKVWSSRSDESADVDFLEVEVSCVDDPMCCAAGESPAMASAAFSARFAAAPQAVASASAPAAPAGFRLAFADCAKGWNSARGPQNYGRYSFQQCGEVCAQQSQCSAFQVQGCEGAECFGDCKGIYGTNGGHLYDGQCEGEGFATYVKVQEDGYDDAVWEYPSCKPRCLENGKPKKDRIYKVEGRPHSCYKSKTGEGSLDADSLHWPDFTGSSCHPY